MVGKEQMCAVLVQTNAESLICLRDVYGTVKKEIRQLAADFEKAYDRVFA